MQISTNWLNYILNLNQINLTELKERLTLAGFEVEETKTIKVLKRTDVILDLAATTNRPDILSIAGIVNEITSLMDVDINPPFFKKKDVNFFSNYEKNIEDLSSNSLNLNNTLAYIGSKIEGISFKEPPVWIQRRLLSNGLTPEKNLNDLGNYLTLEWGQPFFIYDFDKIKTLTKNENPQIQTRFAELGETFIDSDLKKYYLTKETLLVVADNYPISIAGSKISKEVCIDSDTKNIFIEASIFDPKIFRNSERSVGIRTEASLRYERGVNKFLLKPSYNRFLKLFKLLNNNDLLKTNLYIKYFKEKDVRMRKISLSYDNVSNTLGFISNKTHNRLVSLERKGSLSNKEICKSLERSNFILVEKPLQSEWTVSVPFTRFLDIEEEIDIIEEIARVIGFNNFVSILPKPNKIGKISKYVNNRRKFRQAFLSLGFVEVFNYPLTQLEEKGGNPKLLNPLTNEYSSLRTSLVPQLVKTLHINIAQGNQVLPIFEIGRTFGKKSNNNIFETESIGAIFGGGNYKTSWSEQIQEFNWFQAKGVLEKIFSSLKIEFELTNSDQHTEFYHPKNSLEILLDKKKVGNFGKIHPQIADEQGLSKNCFLFELSLTKLMKIKKERKMITYQGYSLYPNITVDLSLLVPKQVRFESIEKIIKINGKSLLNKIELFDFYEKFSLSENCYSLAVKLYFKSLNKTLLKTEIDPILLSMEQELEKKLNIKVRT
uniref:hypothetical protein n=1 Tax=Chattonella marina TaxID=90936 RepID=UPI002115A9C6|nr:hypothetical protein NQZ11_pgp072 [Chattonella marina]UTE94878.1 hypothetical protein CmarPt_p115 [Chattonella marina]